MEILVSHRARKSPALPQPASLPVPRANCATDPARRTEAAPTGRRARDLVRQILTFSRNETTIRSTLHLAEVVHETTRLLKVTLPPSIELLVRIDQNVPHVLADATQVPSADSVCWSGLPGCGG